MLTRSVLKSCAVIGESVLCRLRPQDAVILLAAITCLGCGSGRPDITPVSGQVLIDGQPLCYGVIQFVPSRSRASFGNLDKQGRFQLTCRDTADGAVLGTHSVGINGEKCCPPLISLRRPNGMLQKNTQIRRLRVCCKRYLVRWTISLSTLLGMEKARS